jgi:large subunit ribosomal protein L24
MKRLKVGDQVKVLRGKDRGKQGKITKILTEDNKVVVEGINTVTRHTKPGGRNQQGGKVTKDAPIHASNVMPIDPETGKPTRVKIRTAEDGTKTRVAKSGATITAS